MTFSVFLIFIGFVLGACFGSFFNVIIYRLPKEESIVLPASHCMVCGEPIRWYDNIPIISYFILRGKCRDCGAGFSIRYSLVELLTGILFAMVVAKYMHYITGTGFVNGKLVGQNLYWGMGLTVFHLFFISGLVIAAFIDIDHQIIPNEVTFSGVPIGIIASTLFPSMQFPGSELAHSYLMGLLMSVISAVAFGGVLFLLGEIMTRALKKEAMGFGDVKLLAMIGAFMGWKLTGICIFFASLSGVFVTVLLIAFKKVDRYGRIPFGPYIVLGAILSYFWGLRILEWYFGFFTPAIGV